MPHEHSSDTTHATAALSSHRRWRWAQRRWPRRRSRQRARVLRYGSMLPADSIYHRAILMFADELAKLSSGKLKVEVYPELAARHDPRDAVGDADRLAANDHGGVGLVSRSS